MSKLGTQGVSISMMPEEWTAHLRSINRSPKTLSSPISIFSTGGLFEKWKVASNSYLWLHEIRTFSIEPSESRLLLMGQHSWRWESYLMVSAPFTRLLDDNKQVCSALLSLTILLVNASQDHRSQSHSSTSIFRTRTHGRRQFSGL